MNYSLFILHLKRQFHTCYHATCQRLRDAITLGISIWHIVPSEEIYATEINGSTMNELHCLEDRNWQLIVKFHVAKFQVRAIHQPERRVLIVIVVAIGTESWIESGLCGLRCPTIVVGILRDVGVADERPVHSLGIEHTRILTCTLEHHVESQSLPLCSKVELIVDAWSGGVTDGNLIVLIYLAIIIDVGILDVAWLRQRRSA